MTFIVLSAQVRSASLDHRPEPSVPFVSPQVPSLPQPHQPSISNQFPQNSPQSPSQSYFAPSFESSIAIVQESAPKSPSGLYEASSIGSAGQQHILPNSAPTAPSGLYNLPSAAPVAQKPFNPSPPLGVSSSTSVAQQSLTPSSLPSTPSFLYGLPSKTPGQPSAVSSIVSSGQSSSLVGSQQTISQGFSVAQDSSSSDQGIKNSLINDLASTGSVITGATITDGAAKTGGTTCSDGQIISGNGICESVKAGAQYYLYDVPPLPEIPTKTPQLPKQKTHYNLVLLRLPGTKDKVEYINSPKPKEKTVVFIVQGDKKQEIITPVTEAFRPEQPSIIYVNPAESQSGASSIVNSQTSSGYSYQPPQSSSLLTSSNSKSPAGYNSNP